jgi:hypothetical protein
MGSIISVTTGPSRQAQLGVSTSYTVLQTVPARVFEVALGAARDAGLVGCRRVLDSTPLYDAVATMDTVTLIGSALRGLLGVVAGEVEAELRAVLCGGEDYVATGKD